MILFSGRISSSRFMRNIPGKASVDIMLKQYCDVTIFMTAPEERCKPRYGRKCVVGLVRERLVYSSTNSYQAFSRSLETFESKEDLYNPVLAYSRL
jgi:hypothetical protein